MQNNKYVQPGRRSQFRSIDGVSRPSRVSTVKKIPIKVDSLSKPPVSSPILGDIKKTAATSITSTQEIPKNQVESISIDNSKSRRQRRKDGRHNRSKKLTRKKIIKRSLLAVVLLIVGMGGFVGIRGINTIDKVFHGNVVTDAEALFSNTPLKGESSGRVNILLAGDSADDPNHQGAQLTDSILVLSVDTQNHTAILLSIPRDLWVDIPGYGWQKINAANTALGTNFPGYPQNGMGQLQHIVATDLGIPIDYYALSDYSAFKDAVDAVGGVNVDIQSPDPRGLYDPNTNLKLPNGDNFLSGQVALNLARARGDGYGSYGFPDSDFDRTEHQRQIFTAIVQKAKSIGVLSNPVKISDLFNAVGNNVQTNMSLQNILRLDQITKGINLSNIKSYSYCSTISLGQNGCTSAILTTYTDPGSGQEALIPTAGIGEYGQLEQYYQQLTSNNPVVKEGSSVVILNASDVDGLAKNEQSKLQSEGIDVEAIADASNEYPNTMIVDNSGGKMPNTLKLLQKLYPGMTVTTDTAPAEATEAQGYTSNFVVILGQNWDNSQ
jgi:LCP family protein required for cell wall assembly